MADALTIQTEKVDKSVRETAEAAAQAQEALKKAWHTTLAHQKSAPALRLNNIPRQPTGQFVGRQKMLAKLDELLICGVSGAVGPLVVLHALGSMGKTQTVLAYLRHSSERRKGPVWVLQCGSRSSLSFGLKQLALQAGLPVEGLTCSQIHEAVIAWLESPEQTDWLLVIENADIAADISWLLQPGTLPRNGGSVLVTSQSAIAWPHGQPAIQLIELPRLSQEEASQIVSGLSGSSDQAALLAFVQEVGMTPLPLSIGACVCAEARVSLSEFATKINVAARGVKQLEKSSTSREYSPTVAAVWAAAAETLSSCQPNEVALLQKLSFFAPDPVPAALVSQLAAQEGVGDTQSVGLTLSRYGLAHLGFDGSIEVHRLVQVAVLASLPADLKAVRLQQASAALATVQELGVALLHKAVLPHGLALAEHSSKVQAAPLFQWAASVCAREADFASAATYSKRAVSFYRALQDVGKVGLALALVSLGEALSSQEKASEAEQHIREALQLQRAIFGESHMAVSTTLRVLARVYRMQGKGIDAERCEQQAEMPGAAAAPSDPPQVDATGPALAELATAQPTPAEPAPAPAEEEAPGFCALS
eukprot:TRINITY_DN4672_c0_g1_i1.p1 TRINITY_DN4672_c0_g1~~TRINITY_DN4672_c0_g1_i1.p1  ORF type:complete len:593 (-),score=129.56 TRINITY_DN4672_c0_g1_i1:6-1784(-)